MNVVYGCVTNSLERVQRYVIPHIGDRELIVLWNQTSLSWAYNTIINACRGDNMGNGTKPEALILLHDDLELIDPQGERKILEALEMSDVVGVAGANGVRDLAWWNGATLGHQFTDSGLVDFGQRSGPAEALEGSLLALNERALRALRFDEAYTGFHGYDVDVCFEARVMGLKVSVIDVDTHHHSTLGFKSSEIERSWNHANTWFREKWA